MSVDYKSKIDKKLKEYINDVKYFKEILYKHNAYIAGGFLLSAITDNSFETSDIDIYVSSLHFDSLFETLRLWKECYITSNFGDKDTIFKTLSDKEIQCSNKKLIDGKCSLIIASEYDHSFFKKNNIKFKIDVTLNGHYSKEWLKCDIMVVNTGTNVLDVVNNFDLTCCQLWYNGSDFNGSHLKDIKLKKAYLNKDYVSALMDNNYFIKNRILKYTKRGFQIEIPNYIYKITEKEKSVSNIDRFVVKLVINYYITHLQNIIKYYSVRAVMHKASINALKNLNIFEYHNYVDKFKLKCKKMCLLDMELRAKNYDRSYTVDLVCFMIGKYVNSFNHYSVTELELNTILYFGTDYKFALQNIHSLFTSALQRTDDNNKKRRIEKIIKKMEKFIGKKNDPLTVFKNYVTNDFNLPFVKKVESLELDIDFTLEGRDIVAMEDRTIEEHLKLDPNNICIIGMKDSKDGKDSKDNKDGKDNKDNKDSKDGKDSKDSKDSKYTINLTNIDSLAIYFRDMNSGWFYKCIRPNTMRENNIDESIAYVKIPLSFNIYVPYYELYDIIKNKNQIVFYKTTEITIDYTANHVNTFPYHPNNRHIEERFVSAAHCQTGSSITVFKLYKLGNTDNKSKSKSNSLFKNLKKISNAKATSEPYKKSKTRVLNALNKSKT